MASRSKVHPSHKTLYRVTNWAEYDKGLVERGSLTIWLAEVPDHTTLSRRRRRLRARPTAPCSSKPIHLFIDATGLKVFGQGEWARARHGSKGAQAGWRKLHIGVDSRGIVVTSELTNSNVAHARAFPGLVRRVRSPIKRVTTDGSYDRRRVWRVIDELGARGVIPLHRKAVRREEASSSL